MAGLLAEHAIDALPYFDDLAKQILKADARECDVADTLMIYESTSFVGHNQKRVEDANFSLTLDCSLKSDQLCVDEFMRATWGEMIDNAFRHMFYVGAKRDASDGYQPGSVYASMLCQNGSVIALILDDGPGFPNELKKKYHRRTQKIRDSQRIPVVEMDAQTRAAYIDGDAGGFGLVMARQYCEKVGGYMLIGDARITARELGLDMDGARVQMSWPVVNLVRLDELLLSDQSETQGA